MGEKDSGVEILHKYNECLQNTRMLGKSMHNTAILKCRIDLVCKMKKLEVVLTCIIWQCYLRFIIGIQANGGGGEM